MYTTHDCPSQSQMVQLWIQDALLAEDSVFQAPKAEKSC